MDTLAGDPLAHLSLTNNTPAEVVRTVAGLDKPLLVTGGGGYHVENTVRGWALAWSVLCGDDIGHDDLSAGLGGVLMETTEWHGGLRDRELIPSAGQERTIGPAVDAVIERVKAHVFARHGL